MSHPFTITAECDHLEQETQLPSDVVAQQVVQTTAFSLSLERGSGGNTD